jgi:hypothetical protein
VRRGCPLFGRADFGLGLVAFGRTPFGGHRRPNSLVSRSEPVPGICSITPKICWLEPKHGKSRQENIYFGSQLLLQLLDGKGAFVVREFLSLSPNLVYTFTYATRHGANDRDVIFRPSLRRSCGFSAGVLDGHKLA